MRWRGYLISIGLCVATVACDRESPASVKRDLGSHMAGSWTVRLMLERLPVLAARTTSSKHTLLGSFAFVASGDRARSSAAAYGVYDIDFASLGVPRGRGVPAATLLALAMDSVEIKLDPINDANVVMRGQLRGDSIIGIWDVSVPRVTEGGGRFQMVRRRER
jgi:hypothetical protein